MEGQAKEVFRAWMSRQPYANVTVSGKNSLSFSLSLPLSHNMIGTLHCSMMRLADGTQI